jgi:hypothetical protein
MGLFESFLGDLVLVLMQQPLVRWGLALAASLWVWMIGDEDARLRRFYLLAPFFVAGFVEVSEILFAGQGSRLSQLLVVQEAARRLASLIGLGAIILAAILGYMRGIGFAIGVAVLLCAYFVDGFTAREAQRAFSSAAVAQLLMLLPTVLVLMLTAYGFGASFRRFRESRRYREHPRDRD